MKNLKLKSKQVIDYLGMVGDSVDNIPGLQGVGDKTAKKLSKNLEALKTIGEHR